jgi:hypothetical protein
MDLKDTVCEYVDWIHLAQWLNAVARVINLQVSQIAENVFSSLATTSFPRTLPLTSDQVYFSA